MMIMMMISGYLGNYSKPNYIIEMDKPLGFPPPKILGTILDRTKNLKN